MFSADSLPENLPDSVKEFILENSSVSLFSNQNLLNGFNLEDSYSSSPPTNLESPSDSSGPSSGTSSNEESEEITKYSNPILRYISDILMDEEDDLERKPCMLQDCLRLQAAEKSFYEVLGGSYPSTSTSTLPQSQIPGSGCFHDDSNIGSADPDGDFGHTTSFESNGSCTTDNSHESDFESSFLLQSSLVESPENTYDVLAPDLFGDTQAAGHFHSGTWIDAIQSQSKPVMTEEGVNVMRSSASAPRGSREKRSHQMDDDTSHEQDGRGSKLSAVFHSENSDTYSEMFDEVLLCKDGRTQSMFCAANEASPSQNGKFQPNVDSGGSNGKAARSKKGTKKTNNGTNTMVDLWTLLTQCAQAVASYDQRSANDTLKQIRQHSSPFGDGLQRLAHYFANGLETRLAAGTPSYTHHYGDGATAADMLKAYKLYITASPLQRITNSFTGRTILNLLGNESSIHIIDFGIFYGFQWPCLIHCLSQRPGGPPKLRITGIDFPQSGFRPAERIEETGRHLENYCRRFKVPFEYNCLAQKWETIRPEDLNINPAEITVVSCLHRLKNLPDETVAVNCPRDAVLKLIRKINPNIFIHGVVNGTYNAPFFLTRFREALFHFSALFDVFEANVPREDTHRLMFEKWSLGRDAVNVIACEGAERFERPETYKQWQVRNRRAGLKQLPVNPEIINRLREVVTREYHKDFVVDVDGKWVLHGWKGRILHAFSTWIPG